jgi:hypothetical protein
VLYHILIEFGIPMKLGQLNCIKTESVAKVHIGKSLCETFHARMVWNKEILYHCCFSVLL